MTPVLETRALCRRFGGLIATRDVSLTFNRGERHALIGPNGAGKTTLVNLLTGAITPTSGQIFLEGRNITGIGPAQRVRCGIARTFQINSLFANFTPLETLSLSIGERLGFGAQWWRSIAGRRQVEDECADLLDQFRLLELMDMPTAHLPYGKQRLLEIALAFSCKPQVMLLDEPAAGVPHAESREIVDAVLGLPPHVAVVLIEHDMDLVFSVATRISVLVNGAVLMSGTPQEVTGSPAVRAAYLGDDDDV
jgi:branched-chain amino acid transport system ATP-binding protein